MKFLKYFFLLGIVVLNSCDGKIIHSETSLSVEYTVGQIPSKGCCRKHDRIEAACVTDKYYRTFYYRDFIENYDEDQYADLKEGDVIQFKLRTTEFESGRSFSTIFGFIKK